MELTTESWKHIYNRSARIALHPYPPFVMFPASPPLLLDNSTRVVLRCTSFHDIVLPFSLAGLHPIQLVQLNQPLRDLVHHLGGYVGDCKPEAALRRPFYQLRALKTHPFQHLRISHLSHRSLTTSLPISSKARQASSSFSGINHAPGRVTTPQSSTKRLATSSDPTSEPYSSGNLT
jgi:hypothetical protein